MMAHRHRRTLSSQPDSTDDLGDLRTTRARMTSLVHPPEWERICTARPPAGSAVAVTSAAELALTEGCRSAMRSGASEPLRSATIGDPAARKGCCPALT